MERFETLTHSPRHPFTFSAQEPTSIKPEEVALAAFYLTRYVRGTAVETQ